MLKYIFIFCLVFLIGELFAQVPVADFTITPNACSSENFEPINNSLNTITQEWDFCHGDFTESPTINPDIGTNISTAYGLKIINNNSTYYGFAINNNLLYRFEFGNSLENTPIVTNLGSFGILTNAEGLDIIKDDDKWIGIIGYGSTTTGGNLTRLIWSDLSQSPTAENIGNFGYSISRIREVQLIKQDSNYILAFSPYGNIFVRVDFGQSILNPLDSTVVYTSSPLTSVEFPVGMTIMKNEGQWKLIIGSVISKSISVFDLGNNLLSEPLFVKNQTFDTWNFLAKLKVVKDDNFYAYVSTANGPSHLLDLKKLLATDSFTETIISDLPIVYGIDIVKDSSSYYVFGAQSKLQRLDFEKPCSALMSFTTQAFPTNAYSLPGNYNISLKVFNNGNYDCMMKSTSISPSQAPQLSSQITGNCLSNPISFTGQQLSGNITDWNWDFGDGLGTSSQQNDSYTYASAGTYQVRLNVTDANGCNNLLIDSVTVYEEPIPDYTLPVGTLCMNNAVAFTNTTTGETGPAVTWTWDFNGEGSSSEKEPSFTFLSSGNKTVTLTSSIPGCANVTQQTMFIEEAPTTSFSFNNVCNSQTTTFNDLTVGAGLTAWNWDFGDGIFSTDQHPTHTYAIAGKYAVTLTVHNNLGCSTSKTDTVYNHAVPVVSFVYDLPCSSTPIQFSDQSIVQDAGLVAWEWNFGDGNTSTERNPQYTYGQTGDFTVQLKAYSQFGCVDSTESSITVIQGPEVDFNWDISCVDELTLFTDITNSFGQPITSWTWLIDDQIFNEQNPQYNFGASGTYAVQLSVTTNNLCAQTISKDINVEATPVTSFDYSETCEDDTVTFFDTTPASTTQWEWKVDGTVSSIDSVMPKNLLPGSYMISLATTTSGCTGALSQNINIVGSPTAQFTASTNYGAAPLRIQFTNESTGADNYFWDFGDASNSSSTEINPEFIFNNIGMYNVTLIAYGGQNCADTTVQSIEVVDAIHGLSLDAITLLDGGSLALTLENLGSYTYNEDNLQLVFTLDNGAEIPEPFATVLYPQKTINYVPNITLGDINNSQVLCAELQFIDAIPLVVLDKNCLNLNSQATIADAYPNPANDFINLSVILPESGNVRITFIDRTGAVIMNETYEAALLGLNNYTIDTTPYRSGLYIVKIETDNVVKKMKVVIDR